MKEEPEVTTESQLPRPASESVGGTLSPAAATVPAGVHHILITPFDADEQIDEASLRRLVRFAVDAGVDGLVVLSVMGEAHKLLDRERDEILSITVDEASGDVPVIAYCSAESTVAAVSRAEAAQRIGAAGLLLAPPRNVRNPDALRRHYFAVADAVDVSIVVQDEPVSSGVDLNVGLLAEMLEHPRISAVKVEETPTPAKISKLVEASPGVLCFGGLAGLYFDEELTRGAVGIMAAFGFPHVLQEIYRHHVANERDQARAAFYKYLPLIRFEAQIPAGPLAGIRKRLLMDRGLLSTSIVRSPSPAVDERTLEDLEALMAAVGID